MRILALFLFLSGLAHAEATTTPASGPPGYVNSSASNLTSGTLNSGRLPPHIVCGGSAPSIAAGAGAGTGPVVTIQAGSGDGCGKINVTTGTTPSVSSVVATITFAVAWGNTAWCSLWPASAQAALLSGTSQVFLGSSSSSNFTINSGGAALSASASYQWHYQCGAAS